MATKVYNSETVTLINGKSIRLTPLKIKYLREFMIVFDMMQNAQNDEDSLILLTECIKIAMQQYAPEIKTVFDVEDNFDLPTMYKVLETAAGIGTADSSDSKEDDGKVSAKDDNTWKSLDLAKLEAEAFLLGIWKDYEELESCLSMPELMLTLSQKRELDYNEKRFLAGIQGIDLEEETGKKENKWEEMKARVFSGGKTEDPNDILSYQGVTAQKAGFGIGLGLGYEDLTEK